jgi:hypothetical protein
MTARRPWRNARVTAPSRPRQNRYREELEYADLAFLLEPQPLRLPNNEDNEVHAEDQVDDDEAEPVEQLEEPEIPEQPTPDPLPEEEQEWVVRAVKLKNKGNLPEQKIPSGKKIQRGSSLHVFNAMLEHQGGAVTNEQLSKVTGLSKQKVYNACHYLVGKGIILRLMTGIYQVHPDALKLSERVNVDVRFHPNVPSFPAAQERPQALAEPLQAPPAPPMPPTQETDAETALIQSVLELITPHGFQAHHYPALRDWWEATKRLLAVLES